MSEDSKELLINSVKKYINETPELLSLLYDMDLMPEQVTEDKRDWFRMLVLAHWHGTKFGKLTPHSSADTAPDFPPD